MTHSGPMRDSDGTFGPDEPTDLHCPHCNVKVVRCSQWDSNCGGFTDWRYTCSLCGYVWWVEGTDS